ncbi:MAG TPA: alpha/beta fold hydrolase [Tepidisphaeraceae bacterium]|nr:alpha/beta fold hydrolase [Tepidisphaeraceae bacterium]
MTRAHSYLCSLLILLFTATACRADVNDAPAPPGYLLHLPGIAGARSIDHSVVRGIRDGGFSGEIEIYDWTENDPGMHALLAYDRNHQEARHVADMLVQQRSAHPNVPIVLMGHSGGTGIAVWALEDLPDNVQIDTLVLMSSALSPDYDLSKALRHVKGRLYAFSSLADIIVLSTGTKLFGTIDGHKVEAAGRVGFTAPSGADAGQYKKLVALPYDPSWLKWGDRGDHIGGMTRSFGLNVLAPLILHGTMPEVSMPTTAETPTGLGRELPR